MIEDIPTLTRKPYIKRLAVFSGRYTEKSFLSLIIAPITICIYPATLWSAVTLSFATAWQVVVSFVLSEVFSAPPFSLSTAQIGYIYAGPVSGALIGAAICGMLSDRVAEICARKNNGIYEPEFRLFLVVGIAFFMGLGFFLFGILIEAGKSPVVAAVAWGISLIGFQFCSTAIGTYMVDGYERISIEVFIISMIFKNFLFFGFTFFINGWIARWGPARMFNCIGGIQLGICALTIPVYIYGKICRHAFGHHGVSREEKPCTLTK
jgi:MFS family permease